jgi:hypothetical protein
VRDIREREIGTVAKLRLSLNTGRVQLHRVLIRGVQALSSLQRGLIRLLIAVRAYLIA